MFSEMLFFSKLVYLSSSHLLCSEIRSLPSKYPRLNKYNNLVNGVQCVELFLIILNNS
jgi:hypothetical protein